MFDSFKSNFYLPSTISKFDLIGKTPDINVQGRSTFNTFTGGILSILIFILTILTSFYFSREIWEKKNPKVNRSIVPNPLPGDIIIGDEWDFFFGLQFNNTLYIDNSIYTIKGRLFKFIPGEGLKMQEYKIEPCKNDSFRQNHKEHFLQYNINGAWCVSKENIPDLKISNVWGKPGFSFIDVSLWPCKNTTTNTNCKSIEEINSKLNIGVFSIYTLYSITITTDYDEPYKFVVYNDFIPVSYKSFTHSILYFYHSEIRSDVGFLLEESKIKQSFGIDRLKINYYNQPEIDQRFMRFQFQISNWKELYNRNFIKLQDIAAQIGGIINVFYIGSIIINYLIREYFYRRYLVDRFLGFDESIIESHYVQKKFGFNIGVSNMNNFKNYNNREHLDKIDEEHIKDVNKAKNVFDSEITLGEINSEQKVNEINSETDERTLNVDKRLNLITNHKDSSNNKNKNGFINMIDTRSSSVKKELNLKLKQMGNTYTEELKVVKNDLDKILLKNYENLKLPIQILLSKNYKFYNNTCSSILAFPFGKDNNNTLKLINNYYNEISKTLSIESLIETTNSIKLFKKILFTDYENFIFDGFSNSFFEKPMKYFDDNVLECHYLDLEIDSNNLKAKFKKDDKLLLEEKNYHNSLVQLVKQTA